jgi:hypothetical protein
MCAKKHLQFECCSLSYAGWNANLPEHVVRIVRVDDVSVIPPDGAENCRIKSKLKSPPIPISSSVANPSFAILEAMDSALLVLPPQGFPSVRKIIFLTGLTFFWQTPKATFMAASKFVSPYC